MILSFLKMSCNFKITTELNYSQLKTFNLFYNVYVWSCFMCIASLSIYLIIQLRTETNDKFNKIYALSVLPGEDFLEPHDDHHYVAPSPNKDVSLESEALTTLAAALDIQKRGFKEKASKLIKHAFMLAPHNPEVLNYYGEILENEEKLQKADDIFFKALINYPQHQGALANRQRIAPAVQMLDNNMLIEIDKKRDKLAALPSSDLSLMRAKKEAYFLNIHHTVAIEGNTMNLAETRVVVETKMAVAGKSVAEHNEILGMDAAMKFINNSLIHKMGRISVQDILDLHLRVLGPVDPPRSGHLRTMQVYVSGHRPPPPQDLQYLMEQFVVWMNSHAAMSLHPVKLAALVHYKLVYIHPFVDGNGRTSRLLMNMILMQAGYPPVIISKADRNEYYETLKEANMGNLQPFIRFIAKSTERTLDFYISTTIGFDVPALEQDTISETALKLINDNYENSNLLDFKTAEYSSVIFVEDKSNEARRNSESSEEKNTSNVNRNTIFIDNKSVNIKNDDDS